MKTKVLVVVDMQNDFISGSLGSEAAQAIVPYVKEKIWKAQTEGAAIIATKDTHEENYLKTLEGMKLPVPHCIVDTLGWEINDEIKQQLNEGEHKVLLKGTFGANHLTDFVWTVCGLSGHYRNELAEIEICGLCTDICVMANAVLLRTAFPDTIITVDSKACAGVSKESHNAALTVMKSLQIDVI